MKREPTDIEAFNEDRRQRRSYNRDLRTNEREALSNARSTQDRRRIKQEADSLRLSTPSFGSDEDTRSRHTRTGRSPHVKPSAAVLREEEEERIAEETNTDEVSSDDERIEQSNTIDGFEEETLDVVNNDNTAGQRVFLTKAV